MKGAGSSMRQDLGSVQATPDNLRTNDMMMGEPDPEQGCGWVIRRGIVAEYCEGPPDWFDNGWYCIDHIDRVLCCGSRLSPHQKQQVLADPKREIWMARKRQIKSRAAKAKAAQEKEFPAEVTSESGFSWREHQARLNGANR